MDDEIYYQIRDSNGFPVTTAYDSIPEAMKSAEIRLKSWSKEYMKKTQPWGVVKITVRKIGLMDNFKNAV